MKKSVIFFSVLTVCAIGFFTASKAEARTHFNINFNTGASVVERVVTPPVCERVYVPAYAYAPERVYVAPRPILREVRVMPGLRQRVVSPRCGFSFGFGFFG